MSPPWGQRRALFPTEDTGLHRVGLLRGAKESKRVCKAPSGYLTQTRDSAGSPEEITGE